LRWLCANDGDIALNSSAKATRGVLAIITRSPFALLSSNPSAPRPFVHRVVSICSRRLIGNVVAVAVIRGRRSPPSALAAAGGIAAA
jgi:hypothetical protein